LDCLIDGDGTTLRQPPVAPSAERQQANKRIVLYFQLVIFPIDPVNLIEPIKRITANTPGVQPMPFETLDIPHHALGASLNGTYRTPYSFFVVTFPFSSLSMM
jgi:hypothetical protein